MRMAQELPADGKAFALDVNDDYVKVGKPIMEKAGLLSKVCFRYCCKPPDRRSVGVCQGIRIGIAAFIFQLSHYHPMKLI